VASAASMAPQDLNISPRPPKVQVPKQSAGTLRPDRPSWRYSMGAPPCWCGEGKVGWRRTRRRVVARARPSARRGPALPCGHGQARTRGGDHVGPEGPDDLLRAPAAPPAAIGADAAV